MRSRFRDQVFNKDPTIADRFTQEALIWIGLDIHPNVVQAGFVERIEDKPFLILEYVAGGDLSGWINTPRVLEDLPQVLRLACIFVMGDPCHFQRPGCPSRYQAAELSGYRGEYVKVTDFGLAKALSDWGYKDDTFDKDDSDAKLELSRTCRAAGTCTHMVPEQFE